MYCNSYNFRLLPQPTRNYSFLFYLGFIIFFSWDQVLFSWFFICRSSNFRLYPGRCECYVVDPGFSCICPKNVDIFALVSYYLGWTINSLLDISSGVNSVYYIFESMCHWNSSCLFILHSCENPSPLESMSLSKEVQFKTTSLCWLINYPTGLDFKPVQ